MSKRWTWMRVWWFGSALLLTLVWAGPAWAGNRSNGSSCSSNNQCRSNNCAKTPNSSRVCAPAGKTCGFDSPSGYRDVGRAVFLGKRDRARLNAQVATCTSNGWKLEATSGNSCRSRPCKGSSKCIEQKYLRRGQTRENGGTYTGHYCTSGSRDCPVPGSIGANAGDVRTINGDEWQCTEGGNWVLERGAKSQGEDCGGGYTDWCVEGYCAQAGAGRSAERVCVPQAECPLPGGGTVSAGTTRRFGNQNYRCKLGRGWISVSSPKTTVTGPASKTPDRPAHFRGRKKRDKTKLPGQ